MALVIGRLKREDQETQCVQGQPRMDGSGRREGEREEVGREHHLSRTALVLGKAVVFKALCHIGCLSQLPCVTVIFFSIELVIKYHHIFSPFVFCLSLNRMYFLGQRLSCPCHSAA